MTPHPRRELGSQPFTSQHCGKDRGQRRVTATLAHFVARRVSLSADPT